jgi:hypothetical protein
VTPALPGALVSLALLAATPAPADPDAVPRQLVYAGAGVPVPLELHGYDPDLEESGFAVDLLIHGRLWYAAAFFDWPYLFVGLHAGVSGLRASDGQLDIEGYLFAFGPEALLRIPFGPAPDPGWGAGAGIGPTFALSGFEIDAQMKERTKAFGLQAHVWIDRRVVSWFRVGLDVGIAHTFDPIGRPTFFNAPLGSNTILCFTLGPMAVF